MEADFNGLKQRITRMSWGLPLVLGLVSAFVLFQSLGEHGLLTTGSRSGIISLSLLAMQPVLVLGALKLIERSLIDALHINLQRQAFPQKHQPALAQNAADAILSVNARGKIDSWNLGAEQLFGYTAMEAVGCPFSELLGDGPPAKVEARWLTDTVRRVGLVRRHETLCQDETGRMRDVELTAILLTDNQSEDFSGMSLILRDITARKRLEEEKRRINTRLHQQAMEQTHDLAEKVDQLVSANLELQQLDQIRAEFISLVSHQIRAPLTNMAGAVQRMQAECGGVNAACKRMFDIFHQQVMRLDRLVQDVLNTTRIEAGEMQYHPEPVSVLPIVRQAVNQLYSLTPTRPIHISEKPGMPLVFADRDRVIEVLINLLDNADKYTPPDNDVFIEVRADQTDVTISIRDTGPGLPPGDLSRVFDKFYRIDSSDSQAAYGYGLGLYVCRNMVEAQQGHIWAENYPEGGAVFSFSLPIWQD